MTERWNKIKAGIPIARAPTGLPLPRLALPEIDEPGEIARYLLGDGLPGEFPYLNGAYREMYLEPLQEIETGSYGNRNRLTGQRTRQAERRASEWRRSRRHGRATGRTDPPLLRSDARGRHEQALPFPERASALEAPQHRLRRPDALRHRLATPTASSAKSAKAAWPSTRSKTWCGSTTASTSARRISPPR